MAVEAAAAAAAAGMGDGSEAGEDEQQGSGGSGMDEPVSPVVMEGSREGSEGEGGTTEEGIGFEAVGLDGLPVYGPHLPANSDDSEGLGVDGDGEEEVGEEDEEVGSGDMSVARMLQMLSMTAQQQQRAHSTPLVVSAPPAPLMNPTGSPVTAIEELGNVTSPSSAGSRAGGSAGQGQEVGSEDSA
jgi:hypothetical protein